MSTPHPNTEQTLGKPLSGWRLRLYTIIFEADTRAGQLFDQDTALPVRQDTPATIAAVRATEFLVFFMPERCAAVAAIARSDIDRGFVHKFHDQLLCKFKQKRPA